jgi:hypothetical protein
MTLVRELLTEEVPAEGHLLATSDCSLPTMETRPQRRRDAPFLNFVV